MTIDERGRQNEIYCYICWSWFAVVGAATGTAATTLVMRKPRPKKKTLIVNCYRRQRQKVGRQKAQHSTGIPKYSGMVCPDESSPCVALIARDLRAR
jgi:hypothetical protein